MARILIVDDEPCILRALGRELRRLGHEVVAATGSKQAVADGGRFEGAKPEAAVPPAPLALPPVPAPPPPLPRPVRPRPKLDETTDPFSEPPSKAGH